MKTIIIATTLATMISGAALAQANPNAPQPSSDGRGVNIPGITATGTAVDRPDSNQAQEDAAMRRENATNRLSSDGISDGGMSR